MDPISAVAAISSFISVAGALQKLLKKLGKYLKSFMHAVSEIAAIAHEVSGFSLQLIVLQETLESLPESLQQRVSKRNVDQYHLDGAWKLVDDFKKLMLALKPLRGAENANVLAKTYARFKWLRTKTKAELFRASLNSSSCSLNLFVSTVILMRKSYESAEVQRSREKLPGGQSEGSPPRASGRPSDLPLGNRTKPKVVSRSEVIKKLPGRQPERPQPRASERLSDPPLGNQTEPSVAPRSEEITRLELRLETLKTQVRYEQYKTDVGFDACKQLYEKHAAETVDMRMLELSVNATLAMAEEVEMGKMGEMGWEAEAEAEEDEEGEEGEEVEIQMG